VPASTVSEAATASSSSTSFLEHKGAAAGVFTVVGLAGLGIIIGAAMFIIKRQRRYEQDEEGVHFEKYNDSHEPSHDMAEAGTGGYGTMEPASTEVLTPMAGQDAYPDRAIHYGPSMGQEYATANHDGYNNEGYNNEGYDNQQYGIEYPPGTAYGNAVAHEGNYQYNAYDNAQYPTAFDPSAVQYESQPSGSSSHPFADSRNAARPGGAPPVTSPSPSGYSQDTYYGTAAH